MTLHHPTRTTSSTVQPTRKTFTSTFQFFPVFSFYLLHSELYSELDNPIVMESLCYSANKESEDAYDVSTSLTHFAKTMSTTGSRQMPSALNVYGGLLYSVFASRIIGMCVTRLRSVRQVRGAGHDRPCCEFRMRQGPSHCRQVKQPQELASSQRAPGRDVKYFFCNLSLMGRAHL